VSNFALGTALATGASTRLRDDRSVGLFIAGARVPGRLADPGWGALRGFAHEREQHLTWGRQS
jgi:hypothetical protein